MKLEASAAPSRSEGENPTLCRPADNKHTTRQNKYDTEKYTRPLFTMNRVKFSLPVALVHEYKSSKSVVPSYDQRKAKKDKEKRKEEKKKNEKSTEKQKQKRRIRDAALKRKSTKQNTHTHTNQQICFLGGTMPSYASRRNRKKQQQKPPKKTALIGSSRYEYLVFSGLHHETVITSV